MSTIGNAQKAALKWLIRRNGDGVFDRTKVLCAAGDRAGVMRTTWNKLEEAGLVEFYLGRKRVKVTPAGHALDLHDIRESHCKELIRED